jgi:uncharacterized protein (TIGR01440 family)
MRDNIEESVRSVTLELLDKAKLKPNQIVIVGCSTSEIAGHRMGTCSNVEIGGIVFAQINNTLKERGLHLAAQCCEHLNRALIVEREAAGNCDIVNVIPVPNAGGAFAASAYKNFHDPVAIEEILADAGIDIGGTFIGMHLKKVAIPIQLSTRYIGAATVTAARTRPKLIGGTRAVYADDMM